MLYGRGYDWIGIETNTATVNFCLHIAVVIDTCIEYTYEVRYLGSGNHTGSTVGRGHVKV